MPSSLKEKALKGISWNLIQRFGVQGSQFVFGIILARLLQPEDFGLIGIISVFIAIAQVFVNSGFGLAYVQKKEVSDADANTVFFSNLGISLIFYFILWNSAPFISNFYEQSQLTGLIRAMGFIILINAVNVVQVAQLKRAINFKRQTKATLFGAVLSGIIGITGAFWGMGVWSLVLKRMSNSFFVALGFWGTSNWKPSLRFSKESFKNMFSFGGWILGAAIVRTVFNNIYILTIGKFFPVGELGFYTKSKQFQRLASHQLSTAVGSVSFPIFSHIQENITKLQNGMQKFLKHTMMFVVPLSITLIVIAQPFVNLLLGQKWDPMIPYLQLLCVAGIFYPINMVNLQILTAMGKSQLNFRLNLIKNGLRVFNIILMYPWGVLYIIIGEVFISLFSLLINSFFTKRYVNYGLYKQLKDIKEIVLGGFLAGILGYLATSIISNIWLILFFGITITLIVFVAFQYFFNTQFFKAVLNLRNNFIK